MSKFNVGDKVRIARSNLGPGASSREERAKHIGEVHTVDRLYPYGYPQKTGYCFNGVGTWFWTDDELEPAVTFSLPDDLFTLEV